MAEMNKIDYGFYEVNLFEGEMNSDWFLKINPKASFEPSLISVSTYTGPISLDRSDK